MESNGKRVDREGRVLPYATSAVVWGEPGTNGQHSYFQMLHQGTDTIPVEFILVKKADANAGEGRAVSESLARQQGMLLANGLAQSQALMLGQKSAEPHRDFPGNRPSTTFVLDTPDTSLARRADRPLRASRLHGRCGVGDRQLRPVGRRARQGARHRLLPLLDGGDVGPPDWTARPPGCRRVRG